MQEWNPAIKLMVLDLDGTLLNRDKELSPGNYAALLRAAEAGIHVVPCTGRFFRAMPQAVRELPFLRYAITINGAQILDVSADRVLHQALIPPGEAEAVFDALDRLDGIYDCFQDSWGWMDRGLQSRAGEYIRDPHILAMVRNLRAPLEDFRAELRRRNRGVQKIQIFFRDPELRLQSLQELPRQFPGLSITSSLPNNIEINSARANKGDALLVLCRELGIERECTMAFGDGLNDVTMLRTARIGVAMENADPAVKAQADYVTASNDRDGVAKAIRRFCFGE